MVKEFTKFQLEAEKLGRVVVFQVTVFEKVDSKDRKKLFAETQCSDPLHFIIQFIIREAMDFDSLLNKFLTLLEHRGFVPLRFRKKEKNRWLKWIDIEENHPNPRCNS